jgi:hypothetical protein
VKGYGFEMYVMKERARHVAGLSKLTERSKHAGIVDSTLGDATVRERSESRGFATASGTRGSSPLAHARAWVGMAKRIEPRGIYVWRGSARRSPRRVPSKF